MCKSAITLMRMSFGVSAAAIAAETITDRNGARGGLVEVERSGGVNNGVNTGYAYDKANNRINMTMSGKR